MPSVVLHRQHRKGGGTVTNTKLLEKAIEESGLKKCFLAKQIGLSPPGFRNCMTNKAEFKASQIEILCKLLGITDPDKMKAIFFAKTVA